MSAPELTVDLSGNPRVEVFFDPGDLDGSADTLRIYRYSEGREWLVRGGVDVQVGTAALDWEVPFQTDVAYRAQQFDSSGVPLGFTDVGTTVVDVGVPWVHNVLEPTDGIEVGWAGILSGSGSELRRPTVGGVEVTEGDALGQWHGAGRRGVVGMTLGLTTYTAADLDRLQAMLGTYSQRKLAVLVVRAPAPARWPRTFFAGVTDPRELDRTLRFGGDRADLSLSVTEVVPPAPGLVPPFLTYADMEAAYSTYAEAEAAYSTYVEAQRDYSLAGLAG